MTHLIYLSRLVMFASVCLTGSTALAQTPTGSSTPSITATPVSASAVTQQQVQDLLPGQAVEREMAEAETHRYRIELEVNEFLQVRVEQQGVDVTLKLVRPTGEILGARDTPNGNSGPEVLSFISPESGPLILYITRSNGIAQGNYRLTLVLRKNVTDEIVRQVQIEARLFDALRMMSTDQTVAARELGTLIPELRQIGENYLADLAAKQIRVWAVVAQFKLPGELHMQGRTLNTKGDLDSIMAARALFRQSIEAARSFHAKLVEGQFDDVLSPKYRIEWRFSNRLQEINSLMAYGNMSIWAHEYAEALDYQIAALEIIRVVREDLEIVSSEVYTSDSSEVATDEASLLEATGSNLTGNLNKPSEGLNYALRALSAWKQVQIDYEQFRPAGEFHEIICSWLIGQSYDRLEQPSKAIPYLVQAANLAKSKREYRGLALGPLGDLGTIYLNQLDLPQARAAFTDGVRICEELKRKVTLADFLGLLGLSYFVLGEHSAARPYFEQKLTILESDDYVDALRSESQVKTPLPAELSQATGNLPDAATRAGYEWQRWLGLAQVYLILGRGEQASTAVGKALEFARATKRKATVRVTLDAAGTIHEQLKQWDQALSYYERSLELSRELPESADTASSLSSVAAIRLRKQEWRESIEASLRGLSIYEALGADRGVIMTGYSGALTLMIRAERELQNRQLAIFFGKQAIVAVQRERLQLTQMDIVSQRAYTKNKDALYQRVVGMLVDAGRYEESLQILTAYQNEQFYDFEQDRNAAGSPLTLTLQEQQFAAKYKSVATKAGNTQISLDAARRRVGDHPPSPEEQAEIDKLDALANEACEALTALLLRAEAEFSELGVGGAEMPVVPEAANMRDAMRSLSEATNQPVVALYTLCGETRFTVLIVNPAGRIRAFTTEIKREELNQQILQFYAALQSPATNLRPTDPRPLGKKLYDVIFGLVEAELKRQGVQTIMWSLDGSLRYIPMAALYDGEHYLAERFRNVVFTRSEVERLAAAAPARWTGAGFGSTRAQTIDLFGDGWKLKFKALPGVNRELDSIFRPRGGRAGTLPGDVVVDAGFTKTAFLAALQQHRPVVHIASHFVFSPGDSSRSFLLLGDGTPLTLSEMKQQLHLFTGTDLLTLSACRTAATQSDANGREIDGFAELAQRLGARSVLASLWPVADESTSLLMAEFYRIKQSNPALTKADALQQAQLALLRGTLKPTGPAISKRDTGPAAGDSPTATAANDAPVGPHFTPNPKRPYAHPYYWAPFVLYGNWR